MYLTDLAHIGLHNLLFIANGRLLGDDLVAIVVSLTNDFINVASLSIRNNLELAQYYKPEVGNTFDVYDYCEVILKYTDTTVFVMDTNLKTTVGAATSANPPFDCNISRGLIEFFLRHRNGDLCEYIKIGIVKMTKLSGTEDLNMFSGKTYRNLARSKRLEITTAIAITQTQTEAIHKNMPSYIGKKIVDCVNHIIDHVKVPTINAQMRKIRQNSIVADAPDREVVDFADTAAKYINATDAIKSRNLGVVLVPGTGCLNLMSGSLIVQSTLDKTGITLNDTPAKAVFYSPQIPPRAALRIDAEIILYPMPLIRSIIEETHRLMKSKIPLPHPETLGVTLSRSSVGSKPKIMKAVSADLHVLIFDPQASLSIPVPSDITNFSSNRTAYQRVVIEYLNRRCESM